jgi:hypothetical protein
MPKQTGSRKGEHTVFVWGLVSCQSLPGNACAPLLQLTVKPILQVASSSSSTRRGTHQRTLLGFLVVCDSMASSDRGGK